MVRGRRLRAVVAFSRPEDDCCSPKSKRRNQKEGDLLNVGNGQSIKQFLESVVGIGFNDALDIKENILEDKTILQENQFIDLNRTPRNFTEQLRQDVVRSPATPHRIELCPEPLDLTNGAPNGGTDSGEEQVVPALDLLPPPPRPKRRLKDDFNLASSVEESGTRTTKTTEQPQPIKHKVTDYFPVRRSVRKTKKTVLEEKQRSLEEALRSECEEGLLVKVFEGKGRGIVTARTFEKGDFVVEYSGELIEISEAKRREQSYAEDHSTGCYMYYFKHKNQQYCIDATAETGRLGRLVNHSRNGNLITRTIMLDGKPRLVLIAKDTIEAGEEVTYDYGDRSKESLKHHPWLAF